MKHVRNQSGIIGISLLILTVLFFIGYVVIHTMRARSQQKQEHSTLQIRSLNG
jgi:flagellar basal body-associated protein FliL